MIKALKYLLLTFLVSLLALGCGEKSGLEGKIEDGKGEPIANVKITATQVQPIKGYEQFEAATGSNGTFHFGKLFPNSEYFLLPQMGDWTTAPIWTLQYEANKLKAHFNKEGWTTEQKMKVQTGPEGETILLASPIVIQPSISRLKGKVVDGKGKPIANLKIIAKQVQPIIGYEQFEATTGSDGTFRFGKLFPSSKYILFPQSDDWKTSVKKKVKSGKEEQKLKFKSPMVIRFTMSKAGVINDFRTGLQWAPDPDPGEHIEWNQANSYAQRLKLGGYDDWQLPTLRELRGLYDSSLKTKYKIDPLFRLGACCPWSSQLKGSYRALVFNFKGGKGEGLGKRSHHVRYINGPFRALAVRFRR